MDSSSQGVPAFVRLAGHPLRWRLLTELARGDLRVRDLMTRVGQPQNLISYHLRVLREGGLVMASRSSFDGRDSFYHLDLDGCAQALATTGTALHPGLGDPATDPRQLPRLTVLFVCTGNSARSPIAEALLRRRAQGRVRALSAGSHPKAQVHPHAVRALREDFGIDIANRRPRPLATLAGDRFDYVITLCDKARQACAEFGDPAHRLHWSIADPAAAVDDAAGGYPAFSRTAADIDKRVRHLLPVLAAAHP